MAGDPFPDAKSGREGIPPRLKPIYAFASTAAGSWFIRRLVPLDRRVMNRTKGRFSLFGPVSLPHLLLTTVGRQSGQPRTNPLSFLRDGDRLLVLGSNFGQTAHPAWSSNLLAHPDATVSVSGEVVPVSAVLLSGDDRECALDKFFEYPMYRAYRGRTHRELRVFALTRG